MSRILKLTSLTLCLASTLFAQAKSQLEFFDSTGANSTAKIGWSGTATDGKFLIETPNDGENVSVKEGVLTAKRIVAADGSKIAKIDTANILWFSGSKASVGSLNNLQAVVSKKADTTYVLNKIPNMAGISADTIKKKADTTWVKTMLQAKVDANLVYQKIKADSITLQDSIAGKASLRGANFTGNVGIGGGTSISRNTANQEALVVNQLANGTIADFRRNGNSKVTINDSGFVGIGTSRPAGRLSVDGAFLIGDGYLPNDYYALFSLEKQGNGQLQIQVSKSFAGWGDLSINPNGGNVGIGATQPEAPLHIKNASGYSVLFERSGSGITTAKKWAIGVDNGGWFIGRTDTTKVAIYIDNNSNICAPGIFTSGQSTCISDRRFKTNITPLTTSLSKIDSLQGVNYDWDRVAFPSRNFPEGKQIGLIAQDVEKVIPEVVHTDAEGYKSLSYDKLSALLIEAVKELKRENEVLRAEVAEIKGRYR